MGFLLKIVEGPNKGAEIALVPGVAVTLGKDESCDIILADQTLPPSPIRLEASDAGVTADDEPLEPFNVKTAGATAFAVGPDDAPWGPLVWPKPEEKIETQKPEAEGPKAGQPSEETTQRSDDPTVLGSDDETTQRSDDKTGHRSRRGCLVTAIVLLVILLLLCWLFRAQIGARTRSLREKAVTKWRVRGGSTAVAETDLPVSSSFALERLAARYGLELEERDDHVTLSGNLATRAERLRATAEAYDARPGVELDLSDDESFKTAADDALFTLTEGMLKVEVATNRYLHIVGASASPLTLKGTMEQLNADLPKLRGFDVSGVKLASIASPMPSAAGTASRQQTHKTPKPEVALPVCGILTKPYPCLVLRDGSRVLEGAPLGESVVLKIEADEVTITNSAGRLTWKP